MEHRHLGVGATVLESQELAALVARRGDLGTVVEQEAGTSGWFHIPIPTPNCINGDFNVRPTACHLLGQGHLSR